MTSTLRVTEEQAKKQNIVSGPVGIADAESEYTEE